MRNIYRVSLSLLAFFISALLLSPFVSAQNPIPNPGFENWTNGEPDQWSTINRTLLGTTFTAVTIDNDNPQQGNASIMLETITEEVFLFGPVTMPGLITLGEIILDIENQTATVDGGVPISGKPQSLHGWFRYLPAGNDLSILGIGLTRWNGTSRDTLSYDYLTLGSQSDWQTFSLPVNYLIGAQPDTMNLLFLSSNALSGTILEGSKLWLDNLWIEFDETPVNQPEDRVNIRIFALENGRVLGVYGATHPGELQLYNLNGAMVFRSRMSAARESQSSALPALATGIYAARYVSDFGAVQVQKILISQ